MLQHSWTSARALQQGRSAAACQCHRAAELPCPGRHPHAPGQANPRASSMSHSRPSRQSQTSHSVRVGDLVSCTISALFSHGTSPRCPPSQSRCLVSVPVKTVHLGGGKAHTLHLPHCITSIQSFNPDLRHLNCGHSLDDRALQTPIRTPCCWFSLSRDSPRIPQAAPPTVLQRPPHPFYGDRKYRWFLGAKLPQRIPALQDSSPQLDVLLPIKSSPLCQPFGQQSWSKMMVRYVDASCLRPGGAHLASSRFFTLSQVDEISHQKLPCGSEILALD